MGDVATGMTVSPFVRSEEARERERRAAREHVTLVAVLGDDFVFDFEGSDDTHVVHTTGMDALACTCPDYQHRGIRCKHQAAYERFSYIDEFRV